MHAKVFAHCPPGDIYSPEEIVIVLGYRGSLEHVPVAISAVDEYKVNHPRLLPE